MRRSSVFVSALLASATSAFAITVDFTAALDGASERPTPTASTGTGTATGQLTGDPGLFVFTYHIEFEGLTGPLSVAHIHDPGPVAPPFTEAVGPPAHDIATLTSPIDGVWSYTDVTQPLTDDLAAALQEGRMYINLHTESFPDGEIRGQLLASVSPPPPPPPPPGVIPLPPGVYTGMLTMAAAGWSVWRTRVRV